VAGLNENKANSASQLKLGLELIFLAGESTYSKCTKI
jgi:hypothetical protein